MDIRSFLLHVNPALPAADMELLFAQTKSVLFPKGTIITQSGAVQKDLFFVLNGIQMSYYESDRKQYVMGFTYLPSLSGIPDSFLKQTPAAYSLQALTDSDLLAIDHQSLMNVFDESPGLERLFRKITEQILCGLIDRHLELHAFSIQDRFLRFAHRSPHLLQLVPHKYIASYLNIDATNFSKLFNRIKI